MAPGESVPSEHLADHELRNSLVSETCSPSGENPIEGVTGALTDRNTMSESASPRKRSNSQGSQDGSNGRDNCVAHRSSPHRSGGSQ